MIEFEVGCVAMQDGFEVAGLLKIGGGEGVLDEGEWIVEEVDVRRGVGFILPPLVIIILLHSY